MIEPIDPRVFLKDLEQQLAIMAPEQQFVFGAFCLSGISRITQP
jgi:hypothetical protein